MSNKTLVKAPNRAFTASVYNIFLAGAIDNGEAEQWQDIVYEKLKPTIPTVAFNPRRDDWDADASEELITAQINWELEALNEADLVIFYIPGNSKAPITLLELGLILGSDKDCLIYCDPEYYRFLNVKTTCEFFHEKLYTDKEEFYQALELI